jgi:hypothetical protein
VSETTTFRRLVLELGHGAADPAMINQAAAFARLIDAELHALFVEDEILLRAGGLPFAREISSLSHEWRPLRPDRLEAEWRAAADQARRHLDQAARAIGIRRSFEVRRGDLASQVTEICVASDIVVVASPRRETTYGSQRWRETARGSAASVLFLPPDAGRGRGSVVSVVTDAGDPGLAVARRIADQERERLVVLAPEVSAMGTELGSEVRGGAVIRLPAGWSAQDILVALGDTRERLIVLTRADDAIPVDMVTALVASRGVPVLLVEPAATC